MLSLLNVCDNQKSQEKHNNLIKLVKSNQAKSDSQSDNFIGNAQSALGVCFWFDCDSRCDNMWLMNLEF